MLSQALIRYDMRLLAGEKSNKVKIDNLIPFRPRPDSDQSELERKIDEVL